MVGSLWVNWRNSWMSPHDYCMHMLRGDQGLIPHSNLSTKFQSLALTYGSRSTANAFWKRALVVKLRHCWVRAMLSWWCWPLLRRSSSGVLIDSDAVAEYYCCKTTFTLLASLFSPSSQFLSYSLWITAEENLFNNEAHFWECLLDIIIAVVWFSTYLRKTVLSDGFRWYIYIYWCYIYTI